MKRFFFILASIVTVLAVSCQKEQVITPDNPVDEVTESNIESLPSTITGTIVDEQTRTAYDQDGKFTWLSSDRVRLLVCEDLTTYSRIGIYSYLIKSLSDDGKTAVFTSTSSAGDLTAFVDGTWKSTGIAMYPESALARFSTPESHSYGTPWFTLARNGSVSGSISDIILTGVNSSSISNFKFSTAMAVLKVTLRNIPASAAAIKLSTSDKTNYPLDGDFALTINGDKVDMSFLSTWVSDFKGYQKIDISSEGEIAERSFYFNIPAASYPANTLSLRIEDANENMILGRTIGAPLNIARGECLEVPALENSNVIAFQDNCLASAPVITWAINCTRVRFCVSSNSAIDISEFTSGYTFMNQSGTGRYLGSYNINSYSNQKPSSTGQYYLHYILQSGSGGVPTSLTDANVVAYGTIPFYFISSDDASSFAKQYNFTKTDGTNFWHPGTGSNYATTMTLAVSDDVTKGNLMISELYGKSGANKKVYGVLTSSDAASMTFAYNGDNSGEHFFYQNGNYFHVSQGSTHDAASSSDIVFSIASGPVLTCENYLMMKYTNNYSSWNEFISGVGLVFN